MDMNKIRYYIVLLLVGCAQWVAAQGYISGTVSEMIGGVKEGCVGANVAIVNSQNRVLTGATTDLMGNYTLNVPDEKDELTVVFSYIGMKSQRFKYTGQTKIDVLMEADAQTLVEVEIEAKKIERNDLGISQKEMAFATQKVEMSEIVQNSPVSSLEEALQGRLSGVDIIASGDPGAKSSIRIRGTATLNSNADPLIVVNGIPYSTDIDESFDFNTANTEDFADMLSLNPNDIESIEVLKDAASTAVYGTAGANGVLLVTTKKGTQGKTRFSFSSKNSYKVEPPSMPMLDGDEYVAFIQDAIWNTANARGLNSSADLLKLLFDTPDIGYMTDWRYFDEYNQDVDWLDYVKKDAFITDNSFSMSGGGDRATYRFSLSYLDEGGTSIGTGMDRLSANLRIGYNFSDKLRIDTEYSYADTDKDANFTTNTRAEALRKMPNKSPYYIDDATGEMTDIYFLRQNAEDFQGAFSGKTDGGDFKNFHPIIMANESYRNTNTREQKMNFRLYYDLSPALTYSAYVSMKYKTSNTKAFLPQAATDVTINNTFANLSADDNTNNLSLQTENKLMFRKRWNEDMHSVVATGIWRTSQSTSSKYASMIYGAASAGMSDPSAGGAVTSIGSSESEVRSLSGIGSFAYTLLNRYSLNATFNYEGKSSLGNDNRWGFFPSVGVAWNMQDEPFMENIRDVWSQFKVRASYGESGNAPSGTAPYMGSYTAIGQYGTGSAIVPQSMQLNKLKWETSREYNIGVDFGFFKDKLTGTIDYYYKKTKDLLHKDYTIPLAVGFSSGKMNYYNSGEMTNRGLEFRMDYHAIDTKDWDLTFNFNISNNVNTIDKLPENMTSMVYTAKNGEYAQKLVMGTSVGSFFGYRYLGVYQNTEDTYARGEDGSIMRDLYGNPIVMKNIDNKGTCYPGDAKYEDVNYDGIIDKNDIVYLGNYNPTLSGGGGFNLKYKNLGMTVFMHYRLGQKVINQARMDAESMYGSDNQSKAVLRRWRNEGDDTDIPRALWGYGYNYLGSDRFVEDCSYLRLKTLSFNYVCPKSWCKQLHVNTISLYLTGYDLFTFSNYTGQDPEVSLPSKITDLAVDKAQTPRSKRYAFGITVNF
ncbi:MAG: SusC/RagA family TonB-linked outer membrane protein [Bacteroidaceae bacterium]|nr:SusC/RagA family TonB-linked outer membrane protein [Bacteroidaceae bacterium]